MDWPNPTKGRNLVSQVINALLEPSAYTLENSVPTNEHPLRHAVAHAMTDYFKRLDGHAPANVYQMVMEQIEVPLLKAIMHFTRGNQCKAAIILGISRGTLRKKLKQYGML